MNLKRSPIIALIILGIVIVASGAVYLYLVNNSSVFKSTSGIISLKKILPSSSTATTPAKLVQSTLDGTQTTEDLASRHPLGVMIENHPDARPQSGLSSASIIYEAIAEGGITRFLAIFGPHDATKVGPIRSARTYYADWCNEYDCYYAHVGGSHEALYEKIPTDKIKDIDQFANGKYYHRESKANIATEHTVYSSTDTLYELVGTKKWSGPVREDYAIYSFVDDPTTRNTPTVTDIKIDFSSPQYLVEYKYDIASNSYLRSLAGAPHLDASNSKQLSAKNILVQYISRTAVNSDVYKTVYAMPTVGSGKATIYQNGTKIDGTWKKTDKYSRTQFLDASGKLISLYRGTTWVEIVNPGSTVTGS